MNSNHARCVRMRCECAASLAAHTSMHPRTIEPVNHRTIELSNHESSNIEPSNHPCIELSNYRTILWNHQTSNHPCRRHTGASVVASANCCGIIELSLRMRCECVVCEFCVRMRRARMRRARMRRARMRCARMRRANASCANASCANVCEHDLRLNIVVTLTTYNRYSNRMEQNTPDMLGSWPPPVSDLWEIRMLKIEVRRLQMRDWLSQCAGCHWPDFDRDEMERDYDTVCKQPSALGHLLAQYVSSGLCEESVASIGNVQRLKGMKRQACDDAGIHQKYASAKAAEIRIAQAMPKSEAKLRKAMHMRNVRKRKKNDESEVYEILDALIFKVQLRSAGCNKYEMERFESWLHSKGAQDDFDSGNEVRIYIIEPMKHRNIETSNHRNNTLRYRRAGGTPPHTPPTPVRKQLNHRIHLPIVSNRSLPISHLFESHADR